MTKSSYQHHNQITERKIIRGFSNLLKQTKTIETIKVSQIASASRISRQTFYKYYESKEDFIEQSIAIILDDITKILTNDLKFGYDVIVEMLTYLKDNRDIILPFIHYYPNIDNILTNYIRTTVINSTIVNIEDKLEQAYQLPGIYSLEIYITTIKMIITTWLINDEQTSPDKIATYILKSVKI
ncbi:TetR/AcrR family transcriptional regulator [Streptococcus pluranimalium]|uniref:TetR/AcrR family transcriptional regulator n=1 Tax=Streptococcus hyovaginalis TaxID=149015 RepID=UPI002A7B7BEA|nr:TetR/AcrR family transcriptional regulator [Streptococcus hyovaginalis]MDY3024045.1 TetR/AcrR family transcriptional regulator [Streptococcus hyovaginalis]MDY4510566.1 TetR/AcrR family transcriptional regulator [Streptococcus hyovaginalis]MDY5974861.1 TetR/AcrR family transcriptional regulator [Streptococcus hyovaginalis]